MGSFSIWHWLIVLAIALLLFGGAGKIPKLMRDMGQGITAFKRGMKEEDKGKPAEKGAKGSSRERPRASRIARTSASVLRPCCAARSRNARCTSSGTLRTVRTAMATPPGDDVADSKYSLVLSRRRGKAEARHGTSLHADLPGHGGGDEGGATFSIGPESECLQDLLWVDFRRGDKATHEIEIPV